MKKTIILLTMLLATVGGPLSAQDTVTGPRGSYYYNYYPLEHKEDISFGFGPQVACILGGGEIAKRCLTDGKDSLEVFGIAVALTTMLDKNGEPDFGPMPENPDWTDTYRNTYDHTFNDCWEYLRLYTRDRGVDSLRWIKQVQVHRLHDTPACYLNMEDATYSPMPVVPVYEKYFDNPVKVIDSFYVGMTQRTCWYGYKDSTGHMWAYKQFWFMIMSYYSQEDPVPERHAIRGVAWYDTTVSWGFQNSRNYYYMFPILAIDTTASPIDTVTPGGDTTGMQRADLVSRYVSVLPNPAHERAEVLSSFGLTKIELYDEQGRRLRSLPASGLKATLDLHTLPPATYLLRIHTPAGKCTKKLIVR